MRFTIINLYVCTFVFVFSLSTFDGFNVYGFHLPFDINFDVLKGFLLLPLMLASFYGNFLCLVTNKRRSIGNPLTSILCLLVSLSWFYGIFLAYLNSVDLFAAFSNFNFLSLFGLYNYFCYALSPRRFQILLLVFNKSLFFSFLLLTLFVYVSLMFQFGLPVLGLMSNMYIPLWYSSIPVAYCVCSRQIRSSIAPPLLRYAFLVCFAVAFIGYTVSVTYVLIGILLFAITFFFTSNKFIRLVSLSVGLTFFVLFFLSSFIAYHLDDLSLDPRVDQLTLVLEYMPLFGNGLGASLPWLLARGNAYSMELMYLNIIHKIGIFAVPFFLLYIRAAFSIAATLQRSFFRPAHLSRDNLLSIFYLVPYIVSGLFNPSGSFQFSALFICIGLYLPASPLRYIKDLPE